MRVIKIQKYHFLPILLRMVSSSAAESCSVFPFSGFFLSFLLSAVLSSLGFFSRFFLSSSLRLLVLSLVLSLSLPFLMLSVKQLFSSSLAGLSCSLDLLFFLKFLRLVLCGKPLGLSAGSLGSSSLSLLLMRSLMVLMVLGKVQILLAMDSLKRSSISRLNSLISLSFSLSRSLDRSDASQFMRCLLLTSDSSSEEQFSRQTSQFSLPSALNYIIMHHRTRSPLKITFPLTTTKTSTVQARKWYYNCVMQNTPYYIAKELIAEIKGEEMIERYPCVDVFIEEMKIVGMSLQVTSHRLLFKSNSSHSLLIKAETIQEVSISESGFFSKEYFIKLHTQYGKLKLSLKGHNEAKITIDGVVKRKAWLVPYVEKKTENTMYTGIFNKIREENQAIKAQSQSVGASFQSFDKLFGNLKEIKKVMSSMKDMSGQTDGDNPEVNKILKDMGFVSVISKDQAGKDYFKELARDLFQVCQGSLFKNYGGMVALLDLFYFYNKKRQLNLLSPQQVLKACELFQSLGLQARIVRYPNNIILIESTTFDALTDFEDNYAKFFTDHAVGYSAQQIARRKGLPVAIVDIKLRNACRAGRLAVSDRIEGIKYYKNLLLVI